MPTGTKELVQQFVGAEASRIFYTPVFMDEDLKRSFTVMPNVRSKKKLYFLNKLEKILKRKIGCGFKPTGKTSMYERYVEVELFHAGLEQCFDEFEDTAMQELLKPGNNITELTGTLIQSISVDKIQEGVALDVQRICWWGDRSLAGNEDYNQIDGLWKKLSAVDPSLMPNVSITDAALTDGDGIAILRSIYDAQTNELRGIDKSQKVFYVTQSVYNQYEADLENAGGGDAGRSALINGQPQLAYRGIPVLVQTRWDGIISELGLGDPHRVILSTPMNFILATDLMSGSIDMSAKVYMDDFDEQMYTKINMKFGVDYIHESLVVLGK